MSVSEAAIDAALASWEGIYTGARPSRYFMRVAIAAALRAQDGSADEARPSEVERLRYENDLLQARMAQIDFPCSPVCHGYIRELGERRELDRLRRMVIELGSPFRSAGAKN